MRYILPALAAAALFVSAGALAADPPAFELILKDHQFAPAELTIPAGQRVKLTVKNQDASAAEFESHDFKAEKVIPPGGEASLLIGPLKPGNYRFYDEFHEKSAQGRLIVK